LGSRVSRPIDLEGIADDGFGYTVKISAPGHLQQKASRHMWHIPKFDLGRRRKSLPEMSEIKDGLNIPMTREVDVREICKKEPLAVPIAVQNDMTNDKS
jgi:hypothetical protein